MDATIPNCLRIENSQNRFQFLQGAIWPAKNTDSLSFQTGNYCEGNYESCYVGVNEDLALFLTSPFTIPRASYRPDLGSIAASKKSAMWQTLM
ncbi:MAG: hypothetical protein DME26_20465 [Verrucomicrobia bacterium]|nr:MAG: hypothetical protein DME26_20465 [Verrucomicrobiota bacterium]